MGTSIILVMTAVILAAAYVYSSVRAEAQGQETLEKPDKTPASDDR